MMYDYNGGGHTVRERYRKEKSERAKELEHSDTWPRLEPGTCPYMHNRLP